jgi:hypothetical protein
MINKDIIKEYYLVKFKCYFSDGDYDKFDHSYITKDDLYVIIPI